MVQELQVLTLSRPFKGSGIWSFCSRGRVAGNRGSVGF